MDKIRLLIAEDEPIIRQGIASAPDWASIGCFVQDTAANGAEALMKADQADIVITDIMMPEMDGLTLCEKLVERNFGGKVILLTGHKEFDFAQKALHIGAFDYVLKPIDPNGLMQTVRRAAQELRAQSAKSREMDALRDHVRQSRPHLLDKLIQDLLFRSDHKPQSIKRQMEYFGYELDRFVLLCAEIDKLRAIETVFSEEDMTILMFLISDCITSVVERNGLSALTTFRNGRVYVIVNYRQEDLGPIMDFALELKNEIESTRGFTVSIGVSRIHDGAESIRLARKETDICMAAKFNIESNSVVYVGDVSDIRSEKRLVSPSRFIGAAARGANIALEAQSLAEQMQGMDEKQVKNCAIEAVVGALRAYCENFGQLDDLGESIPLDFIMTASNAGEIAGELLRIATKLEQAIAQRRNSRHRRAIESAIEFIERGYTGDIGLKDAAQSAFMSPAYFSRLFKKEVGCNFSDYLAELRIKKAKEMLRDEPHLKNYEVAERVGINNAYYFNQLFKRCAGVTPGEYKRDL